MIDRDKLRQAQQDTFTSAGGNILRASKMKDRESYEFRVMPDVHGKLDGLYYVEMNTWWINSKPFVMNPEDDDVVQAEIDFAIEWATENQDKPMAKSLNKLLGGKNKPRLNKSFLINVLMFNDYKRVMDAKPIGSRVIEGSRPFLYAVNAQVLSKNGDNGTEDGIMDREKGFNLALSVTGDNRDIKYTIIPLVQTSSIEIPEEFYSPSKVKDLAAYVAKRTKAPEYLTQAIRHYLYNEPAPVDTDDDEEEAAPAPRREAPRKVEQEVPRAYSKPAQDEYKAPRKPIQDHEEPEEAPARAPRPSATNPTPGTAPGAPRRSADSPSASPRKTRDISAALEDDESDEVPY